MSKKDDYNEYNYNQALGERYTRWKQYTIKCLNIRSRLEV